MENIISFFKRRWWNFVPLVVCLVVGFLVTQRIPVPIPKNDLIRILIGMIFFSIPGSIALLFVRKQTIQIWAIFALCYFIVAIVEIASRDNSNSGWWGWSEQSVHLIDWGIAFSLITILWSIIHTLILRHKEKKNQK